MKRFIVEKDKIKQKIPHILLFIGIAAFYLIVGCPSRVLLGFTCPGCGMTRAVEALLKLDFALAAHYHPLVFLLPFAVAIYFFRRKIPKTVRNALGIAALLLMLAVYIYRLCSGSEIVYFDFEKGTLYKIFQNLFTEG